MPTESSSRGSAAKGKSYSGNCDECNKTFNDIYAHKRASHQPTCQVTFKNGSTVTLHRDVTTGKFKCPGRHCHYMGADPSNINRHAKTSCKSNTFSASEKGKKILKADKPASKTRASSNKKELPRQREKSPVINDSEPTSPLPQVICVLPPGTPHMLLKPQTHRKVPHPEDRRRKFPSTATPIHPVDRVTRSSSRRSKYGTFASPPKSEHRRHAKTRYGSGDEMDVESLL